MIDFDELFEEYVAKWYKENSDNFDSDEELEQHALALYDEWADTACERLGGIKPNMFFAKITSPEEIINIMLGYSAEEMTPSSIILDRVVAIDGTAPLLREIVCDYTKSNMLKILCSNLLREMNAPLPFAEYIKWLSGSDKELSEMAVEVLTDNLSAVKNLLIEKIDGASKTLKENLADILVEATGENKVYDLLIELLVDGDNIPLYSGYLGKYGDERAIPVLERFLENCNYMEFIEIKNAVEMLGGYVEEKGRDFTDDMYYKAIKNVE